MPKPTKDLPRRLRRFALPIALSAAAVAGVVAATQVASIEPHLSSEVRFLTGARDQVLWEIRLRARGGGEVRAVEVRCADDRLILTTPGVGVLKSGETKPIRLLVQDRPDTPLQVNVTYTNPEPRTLDVEIPVW